MELRDKNGLTEEEYLARYQPGKYPRPSVTVDICVLARAQQGLRALLVRRGGHPYLGCWALPGGFVDPQETTQEAAARELFEETHLQGLSLAPIGLFSQPGRDPRTWTMSHAFAALAPDGLTARAGDDAAETRWFDVSLAQEGKDAQLTLYSGDIQLRAQISVMRQRTPFGTVVHCSAVHQEGLAFDHGAILCQALLALL